MKKIIVANWKMNPTSAKEVLDFQKKLSFFFKKRRNLKVVLAPPFPYILLFKPKSGFAIGAQNLFWAKNGSYTGEVSAKILKSVGAEYVIAGHSERRRLGEDDDSISRKVKAGLEEGLKVILAIGEKDQNDSQSWQIIKHQLQQGLKRVNRKSVRNLLIVYEPQFAISTGSVGEPDNPERVFRQTILIRKILTGVFGRKIALSIPVLYGGSADSKNARSFLETEGISGLLVGGASLDSNEFIALLKEAEKANLKFFEK